jgi:hypothetical protein
MIKRTAPTEQELVRLDMMNVALKLYDRSDFKVHFHISEKGVKRPFRLVISWRAFAIGNGTDKVSYFETIELLESHVSRFLKSYYDEN